MNAKQEILEIIDYTRRQKDLPLTCLETDRIRAILETHELVPVDTASKNEDLRVRINEIVDRVCTSEIRVYDAVGKILSAIQLCRIGRQTLARGKTSVRLWAMRRHLIWYAENMPNQDENNYRALDIELRRQAVEVVVYGNAVRPGLKK